MNKKLSRQKARLNRGNLRDMIIIMAFTSVLFSPPAEIPILVGFAALTIGTLLHFLVKGVLVRNSVVCKEGIYSMVRHPYYLANYIIDSAFCIMSGNIYLVLIYPFLFFWAYGPTMQNEENHLRSIHGEQYALFDHSTPQVLPASHSFPDFKGLFFGFSAGRITPQELIRIGRFWGVAFFIALLQELRVDGLMVLRWPEIQKDWDVLVFVILALLMFASSLMIPRTQRLES
ncbi:MAG: hypothetical protein WCA08_00340 [Desulfoferrobacter sp.]